MNALALMFFLLLFLMSTLAHADHLTTHVISAEQQECTLCHQGIDTPPELLKTKINFVVSYHIHPQKITVFQAKTHYFVQPQLRAPPLFQ